jgi:hypothetical protein
MIDELVRETLTTRQRQLVYGVRAAIHRGRRLSVRQEVAIERMHRDVVVTRRILAQDSPA